MQRKRQEEAAAEDAAVESAPHDDVSTDVRDASPTAAARDNDETPATDPASPPPAESASAATAATESQKYVDWETMQEM